MRKSILIIGIGLLLGGCSAGSNLNPKGDSGTRITDEKHPYKYYEVGTVLDKLEDYEGVPYVLEVDTGSGALQAEVSKTEFERAEIGQEVYYKKANLFTLEPTEIRVPNIK
ncbi:hypothetical protein [Metabacillus sp. Hm71]|uniref:hypothetical protein n=1 Tax=Metabacillus sp. Hm71 TaxID=3450743 RepID=UPI003F425EC2